ncbi:MAG TPA: BON domain-containing protein [Chryseosolibacter sp.]
MAEDNRNRQGAYRQPYEWTDNYGRQEQHYNEEPNYTISENRGYRTGRNSETGTGDGSWKTRYEREMDNQRAGDFSGYNQRRMGNRGENDYRYGSMNQGISSAYSDFGGNYRDTEGSRNLYDRGYQGMNRRDLENRENRLGGANYDAYGDRGRYDESPFARGHGGFSYDNYSDRSGERGRDFGRSNYGERYGGQSSYQNRNYGRGESEERSWWDRTADEVSSWFGDEDAERRRERDRNLMGQYRGKGPRNYSRSDERIREDINDRLSDDPFIDATDIEVAVSNGDVTLTGAVDDRSAKRRAEDLAESVSGVKNVENRLRVSQSVAGMNEATTGSRPQSSAPIPGSDRSRKESSYANK